eukprot:3932037-Rhodomonas_salina.5
MQCTWATPKPQPHPFAPLAATAPSPRSAERERERQRGRVVTVVLASGVLRGEAGGAVGEAGAGRQGGGGLRTHKHIKKGTYHNYHEPCAKRAPGFKVCALSLALFQCFLALSTLVRKRKTRPAKTCEACDSRVNVL